MAELVLVADGAVPHENYDFLPEDVVVWCGYVGGHTVHAWTATEIEAVEAAGRPWWGIWTAAQGRALGPGDAAADAAAMITGLERLGRAKILPCFYDVEHSAWAADPHATTQAAQDWVRRLRAAGYVNAYWYGPADSVASWRAHWGIDQPAALPAGVIGVQFDHDLAGGRYDLSVFDPTLFINGGTDAMSAEDVKAINDHTDTMLSRLEKAIWSDDSVGVPTLDRIGDVLHANTDGVRATLASVAAKVNALDPAGFAAALAPLLAAQLPAVTVEELTTALAAVYGDAFGGAHAV